MNILVTGGIGFIGSNYLFINLKKNPNNTYFCLDIFSSTGRESNMVHLLKYDNFKFVNCDIRDKEKLEEIFKEYRFDVVINFAAETSVDYSFKNEKLFMDVNYGGTKNLLDLSIKYNVKRFHQFSTDEVYGSSSSNEKFLGFSNKTLLNPTNPYSLSKAKADEYCLSRLGESTHISISRSSNVFGFNQTVDKLIPHSVLMCLLKKKIEIYGNGSNLREWIHVNDVVSAVDNILLDTSKTIYHIGSGVELTNNETVNLICTSLKELGLNPKIKFVKKRKINDLRYLLELDEIDKSINKAITKEDTTKLIKETVKEMVDLSSNTMILEYYNFCDAKRL